MRQDIASLEGFYQTPLGRHAAAALASRIDALWPGAHGLSLLGIGYPAPLLNGLAASARRTAAVMPDGQGVAAWRAVEPRGNASLLSREDRLPFADQTFDRAILLHALEEAEAPQVMLRELWRVLAPEGRLLVVAANRRGLWARAESTPFGHGRPWTRAQLALLLSQAMFQTTAWTHALHAPPIPGALALSLAHVWERSGETLHSAFGGAVMIEAVKRLYIDPRSGAPEATKSALAKARKGIAGAPKEQAPRDARLGVENGPLTEPENERLICRHTDSKGPAE
ncbi:MAG: methyltransferase domain-containing protein [Pseudomonadota bacterium]